MNKPDLKPSERLRLRKEKSNLYEPGENFLGQNLLIQILDELHAEIKSLKKLTTLAESSLKAKEEENTHLRQRIADGERAIRAMGLICMTDPIAIRENKKEIEWLRSFLSPKE